MYQATFTLEERERHRQLYQINRFGNAIDDVIMWRLSSPRAQERHRHVCELIQEITLQTHPDHMYAWLRYTATDYELLTVHRLLTAIKDDVMEAQGSPRRRVKQVRNRNGELQFELDITGV